MLCARGPGEGGKKAILCAESQWAGKCGKRFIATFASMSSSVTTVWDGWRRGHGPCFQHPE